MAVLIRIASRSNGFRRCGIAHSSEPVDYPADRFSESQIEQMKAEPMLMVSVVNAPVEKPAAVNDDPPKRKPGRPPKTA